MGEVRCLRFRKVRSRRCAGSELRQRLPALGDLTLVVEWALPELKFEDVRGLSASRCAMGKSRRRAGELRRFGGDFVGVDIGEFETPGGGSGRGMDFRREGGQRL